MKDEEREINQLRLYNGLSDPAIIIPSGKLQTQVVNMLNFAD